MLFILLLSVISALCAEAQPPGITEYPHVWVDDGGGKFITALGLDGTGRLWCGSEDAGLNVFDGYWWKKVEPPVRFEYPCSVSLQEQNAVLGWSRSGISTLGPDGRFEPQDIWKGFAGNRVYALLRDREGYLWAGTDRGLWRYDGSWKHFPTSAERASEEGGIFKDSQVVKVTAVVEWNGRILAGTSFHGVWQMEGKGLGPFACEGLPDRRVQALLVVSEEIPNPKSQIPNPRLGTSIPKSRNVNPGPGIRGGGDQQTPTKQPRAKQTLWVGTFRGPAYLEGDKWVKVELPKRKLTEQQIQWGMRTRSEAILSMAEDGENGIWMGARTEGLLRYLPMEKRWQYPAKSKRFPDSFVKCVRADLRRFIWAGTYGAGVAVYEPENLEFRSPWLSLYSADSKVLASVGWVYDDGQQVRALLPFIFGRRLRKVQSQGTRFLTMYFAGAEKANRILKDRVGSDSLEGVVVLDAGTGEVVWSCSRRPLLPVTWNAGMSQFAYVYAGLIENTEGNRFKTRKRRFFAAVDGLGSAEEKTLEIPDVPSRLAFASAEVLHIQFNHGKTLAWEFSRRSKKRHHVTEADTKTAGLVFKDFEKRAASSTQQIRLKHGQDRWQESFEVIHEGKAAIALNDNSPKAMKVPEIRKAIPFEILTAKCRFAESEPGGRQALNLVFEHNGQSNTYTFQRAENGEVEVFLCFPELSGIRPKLTASLTEGGKATLGDIAWWAPTAKEPKKKKLRVVSGDSRQIGEVRAEVRAATFYLVTRGGVGTSREMESVNGRVPALFDSDITTPVWRSPKGLTGWSMELDFGRRIRLNGLVVFGTPGNLSDQAIGLCLESWDKKKEQWNWVGAMHGPPQFQHLLLKECTARRIRIGATTGRASISEILILGKKRLFPFK